jgi:osmoprotectant transport system substrate-binding protein
MSCPTNFVLARLLACAIALATALALSGCGSSNPATAASSAPSTTTATTTTTTTTTALPGIGKPTVYIGDKNYTEQFILGQLYYLALTSQGFSVQLSKNIGPTSVTMQALQQGQLDMYPEYLNYWNTYIAGYHHNYTTESGAYAAAERYAVAHGLELLQPTPFSDTYGIATTVAYAAANRLSTIRDLRKVAGTLTLGAPPDAPDVSQLEQAYGFQPAAEKPLDVGQQYSALDTDVVQAADVNTTDGELATDNYTLLSDPRHVFGVGYVVPVVSAKILAEEGPAFMATINRVSSLLTLQAMREMNYAVDVAGQDPGVVAKQFLADHGVLPATSG